MFKTESEQKYDSTKKEEETKKTEELRNVEEPIKIDFKCKSCGINEQCDYKGKSPAFVKKITFNEDCFIMRDPFSPFVGPTKQNLEHFIILGANCCICENTVCCGTECSFFYFKTFCLNCAKNHIKDFPLEIQSKINKAISNCA